MSLLHNVCGRICAKIKWPEPIAAADVLSFLTEFYSVERAFLEREKLFGRNREHKHSPQG
jgi:hypothetical protein